MAELIGIAIRDVAIVVVLAWVTQKLKLEPFIRLVICCAGPILFSPLIAYSSGYGGDGRTILELFVAAFVVAGFLLRTYVISKDKGEQL